MCNHGIRTSQQMSAAKIPIDAVGLHRDSSNNSHKWTKTTWLSRVESTTHQTLYTYVTEQQESPREGLDILSCWRLRAPLPVNTTVISRQFYAEHMYG